MANRFTVDGKTYTAKPFDFDLVCELEDLGITLERIEKTPMSLVRDYFALCADIEKEEAAAIIQRHLVNGGKMNDIAEPMSKEMDASDFFRALNEGAKERDSESKGKKKETSEEKPTNP